MRRSILTLLILLLFSILPVEAQVDADCGDGVVLVNGVEITLTNPTPDVDYTITAIGLDAFDPVMAVFNAEEVGGCSDDSVNASFYRASLPTTGEVLEAETSAQWLFRSAGQMGVLISEYDDAAGEWLVVIEGSTYDASSSFMNLYDVQITSDMVASGVPLTAYIISTTDGFDPTLAILEESDTPPFCDNAGDPETCFGDSSSLVDASLDTDIISLFGSETDAMLSIPLVEDHIGTTLSFQVGSAGNLSSGSFVFILHMGKGVNTPGDGIASVSSSRSGWVIECDGETLSENGVAFTIPVLDTDYIATAIGDGVYDPILVVLDDDETGICYDDTIAAIDYDASLPTTEMGISNSSAQGILSDNSARFIVGSRESEPGEFVLIIEGGNIAEGSPTDVFSIEISPGMAALESLLSVYAIAADNDFDPQVAQVDGEQQAMLDGEGNAVVCNDAGYTEDCWGDSESLLDYSLTLADGQTLPGFELDAMLNLPLATGMAGGTINFEVSGFNDSIGSYALVIHIVSD